MKTTFLPPVRSVAERNALAEQWQYLPRRIVTQLARALPWLRRYGLDDAEQVGQLALLRAAELWRSDHRTQAGKPVRFSTYAYHCIRGTILSELGNLPLVRVPRGAALKSRQGDSDPDAARAFRGGVSHALVSNQSCDHRTLAQALDSALDLAEILSRVRPRYTLALRLRFVESYGLEELGQALGVGMERARQILLEAMMETRILLGLESRRPQRVVRRRQRRSPLWSQKSAGLCQSCGKSCIRRYRLRRQPKTTPYTLCRACWRRLRGETVRSTREAS